MKVKLFVYSSLGLLGVWLAAAYMHTVDLSSYTGSDDTKELAEETVSEEINEEAKPLVAAQ